MKHNKTDFLQDPSFEQLLKQSLLDNNKHPLNEKTIEMNANYIFSQPSTSISTERLETLLNRHQLDLSKTNSLFQFVLRWVAPIVLLISIAYFANQKFNKGPKQNFIPPVTDRIERDTTQFESLNTQPIKAIDTKEISHKLAYKLKEDSKLKVKQRKKSKASRYTYNDQHIVTPKIKMSYPDLYEAPAPVFNMIASPEDFTLNSSAFKIYGGHALFSIKDLDYFHSYYLGQPFKEGMDDFVWVNPAKDITSREGYTSYFVQEKDSLREFQRIKKNQLLKIPNVLKFHLDDYELSKYNKMQIEKLSKKQLDLLLKPFYFSKYEVSVKEYRAFTNWVLKSNGYEELPYQLDSIPMKTNIISEINTDNIRVLKSRFYVKWSLDKNKAYSYTFKNASKDVLQAIESNSIGIAPKDSIYQKKHNQFEIDYEINPFYGPNGRNTFEELQNRPIVGISYYQALAFLDWKTHFHQEQLDNTGLNYTIEYTLPNTLEKDLAIDDSNYRTELGWLTDLHLERYKKSSLDKLVNPNYFKNSLGSHELNRISSISKRKYIEETDKHKLRNGITWLDGNASEWMADNYQDNWTKVFSIRRKMTDLCEENILSQSIEDFYNKRNDTLGQLVMGGNYLDYRDAFQMYRYPSFNRAGTYLKTFADPHQQYSTVGFRYIIKIKDADEARKEKLLSFLGSFDYDKHKDFPEKHMDDFKKFDEGKYILDKEVTNGMWRSFLMDLLENGKDDEALQCMPESELWSKYNEEYIYYFRELKYDALPVVNISHKAVQIFNQWMTKKFNTYALRKFSVVEFVLPTEAEWEQAAFGKNTYKNYAMWSELSYINVKGELLSNFTFSPYENFNYQFPSDSIYNKESNSKHLSLMLRKKPVPDSCRLYYYEDFLLNNISFKEFMNRYEKDWLSKEKFKIYWSEAQIKKLTKNKNIYKKNHLLTIGKMFPPNLTGLLGRKSDALYDVMGNVAEMVEAPQMTKGGSWNSFAHFSTILRNEPWNGNASPMVGFRPMMKIIKKGFDHNIKVKPDRTPPGVVLLRPDYGVDITEVRNIDYREYMYYIQSLYGKDSKEFNELLLDTNVWDFNFDTKKPYDKNIYPKSDSTLLDGYYHEINEGLQQIGNEPMVRHYHRHPAYNHYPVAGISYQQAQSYCKWRSDRVNERYAIYHAQNPNDKSIPKKMTYRLPTPEEWDQFSIIDSIYLPNTNKKRRISKKQTKSLFTNIVMMNPPNSIGLYDLDGNMSEMTSKKGLAKGEHWAQQYIKTSGKDLKYSKPESWIGFRCVVDLEY